MTYNSSFAQSGSASQPVSTEASASYAAPGAAVAGNSNIAAMVAALRGQLPAAGWTPRAFPAGQAQGAAARPAVQPTQPYNANPRFQGMPSMTGGKGSAAGASPPAARGQMFRYVRPT